ncbi:hypothetical protein RRG08_036829 [Elysia crispata]|uniref:Uncharacterized protein n=1 Tax=Elysia crispata TaxID=231223 RepID=A0AAE1CU41_9GAST|nr:hypothetical protein RRG08_036829 [Elysia crispata]
MASMPTAPPIINSSLCHKCIWQPEMKVRGREMLSAVKFLCLIYISCLLLDTEGFTVWVGNEHKFGDIMEVFIMFESSQVQGSIRASISLGSSTLFVRTLPLQPGNFERIENSAEALRRKGKQDEFLIVIAISTIYMLHRNINRTFTIEAEMLGSGKNGSSQTILRSGITDLRVLNTVITVDDGGGRLTVPTDLTTNIPNVKASNEITFEILNVLSNYTYEMELYLINGIRPSQNLYSVQQVGKIDLSDLNSMDALEPCEMDLTSTTQTLGPHILPEGFLRIVVTLKQNGKVYTEISGYLNVTDRSFLFHVHKEPNADQVTWPFGKDLKIDASSSFFSFMMPSYGTVPGHQFLEQFDLVCLNHTNICNALSNVVLKKPTIYVSSRYTGVPQSVSTLNDLILTLSMTYSVGFRNVTEQINTTVRFLHNGLIVDIICVRNCLFRYLPEIPSKLMASCANCDNVDPAVIKYSWNAGNLTGDGYKSKYFVIKNATLDFSVEVEVEYKHIARKPSGRSQAAFFKGWALRTFRLAITEPSLLVNYSQTWSQQQGAFDTFDLDIRPVTKPSLLPVEAAPVRRFFQLEGRVFKSSNQTDGIKRFYVCTFGNKISNVVLRGVKLTRKIRGLVGLLTADGTKYTQTTKPINQSLYVGLSMPVFNICNATSSYYTSAFGFSGIHSLAREISVRTVSTKILQQCWEMLKHGFSAADLHPAKYPNAYRALYMFIKKMGHTITQDVAMYTLGNMEIMKQFIFENTTQETKELELLTEMFLDITVDALNSRLKLSYKKFSPVEKQLIDYARAASMAMLKLYEKRVSPDAPALSLSFSPS